MYENCRFKLVFAKLASVLEEDAQQAQGEVGVRVRPIAEASPEELDEIDQLRRIVLEMSEPMPMSFTTT